MKHLLITVPMKDPNDAKSRLRAALPDPLRERLALGLFDNLLRLLTGLGPISGWDQVTIATVTASDAVANRARAIGAAVIPDDASDLNGALNCAARWAQARGIDALCVLPGDLAAPTERDIRALLEPLAAGTVTLTPSDDFGTNALVVAPADALPFAYGPGSFHAHLAAAEAAGLVSVVRPLDSLRFDVDTSEDLERLRQLNPGALA